MEVKIALFQKKEIRKTIQENEWWFVITDVIAALTDSVNPAGYFKDMRRRDAGLAEALKGGGNLPPLGLEFHTVGGRQFGKEERAQSRHQGQLPWPHTVRKESGEP